MTENSNRLILGVHISIWTILACMAIILKTLIQMENVSFLTDLEDEIYKQLSCENWKCQSTPYMH